MLPLPSRTHPKKQNLVVYTKELTHLCKHLGDQWTQRQRVQTEEV